MGGGRENQDIGGKECGRGREAIWWKREEQDHRSSPSRVKLFILPERCFILLSENFSYSFVLLNTL